MEELIYQDYLGDGVYVGWDEYHIVLMTGSYDDPDNTIYLDRHVAEQFQNWVTRLSASLSEAKP